MVPLSIDLSESIVGRHALPGNDTTTPGAAPVHVTTNGRAPEGAARRPIRAWAALSLAGQAAALADAKTTLDLKHSYPLAFHEADPLARPFVNLPQPAYFATVVGLTAGVSAISWKLHGSENPWLRRFWWVPQAAQIALNAGCAIANSRK